MSLGKYPISVDFQKIEDAIKELTDFSTCTVIAQNELLMERKYPLDSDTAYWKTMHQKSFQKSFWNI